MVDRTDSAFHDSLKRQFEDSTDWSVWRPRDGCRLQLLTDEDLQHAARLGHAFGAKVADHVGGHQAGAHFVKEAARVVAGDPSDYDDLAAYASKIRNEASRMDLAGLSKIIRSKYEAIVETTWSTPTLPTSSHLADIRSDDLNTMVLSDVVVVAVEAQAPYPTQGINKRGIPVALDAWNPKEDGAEPADYIYIDAQLVVVESDMEHPDYTRPQRRLPLWLFRQDAGSYQEGQRLRVWSVYRATPPRRREKKVGEYYLDSMQCLPLDPRAEAECAPDVLDRFRRDADRDDFLERLTTSFAPHLLGSHIPKLLAWIVAVGAVPMGPYRSEMHAYLVGNPGTGKSEILKAMAKLRYNAAYADAPGASSRGLTYGQDEFQSHKILRAGLMVRFDMLSLDELDKSSRAQRQDINTILEQQIASYHKTGYDVDTPVSISLLAAGNPQHGRWIEHEPLMDNLKPIPAELISRMIVCRVERETDVKSRMGHVFSYLRSREADVPYTESELTQYLARARRHVPTIPDGAEKLVIEFLTSFEQLAQQQNTLPIETRQEIELIRLATAIAKLRLRPQVDDKCIIEAIEFYKACLGSHGLKTEAAPVQMSMKTGKQDMATTFYMAVEKCESFAEDKTFTEADILAAMRSASNEYWPNKYGAEQYWERMRRDRFHEPTPGRFKRV